MATHHARPNPRQGHTEGSTHCAYTPDGRQLVTVGSNNTIRLYKTGFNGEPTNIDECQEQNVAVATSDKFFVVGSEDGTLSLYSLETNSFERFLLRTSLPIRDVALSPDGKWCAVASDELTVKIVSTEDNTVVRTAREHGRPTKHVSFDPKGSLLTLSCSDGVVYVYSLAGPQQPELVRKVDGVIGRLEAEDDAASSQVAWHPDGRAFATPTPTRDIQVMSKNDWEKQRVFSNGGHEGDVTAIAWSPNGAMLASAGKDGKVLVWETGTQSVIARHDYANVVDIAWHPRGGNLISFTTFAGEVFIYPDFLPPQHLPLLKLPTQPAPFIHDPLAEISANNNNNARRGVPLNGAAKDAIPSRPRQDSPDSLDSLLADEDEDDFVVDDDGAGYALNGNGKRPHDGGGLGDASHTSKRVNSHHHNQLLRPTYHEAFQPGSTPWRGNRKYLCLNLTGFVWTVDQDSHNTVTVEFYDHEEHRDYHFTDTSLYDKACLNDRGALFSCPPRDSGRTPAAVLYRPHETWTQQRSDWRTSLPRGESVLAMSLSESFVAVATTAGYVRVYTLFGLPCRVYRPRSSPMVTCASWRDYVLTMGNGPVGPDGRARLLCTIEDVKRDVVCQNEDTVALPEGATVKSVFFSDGGDPCIYDSTGTLLTLLHWRRPSGAVWVPLLDTKLLPRLASGRKTENYYPIAVADNKFHCIILKGGDQYPYFPRPLLSEFDFSVPLTSAPPRGRRKKKGDGDVEGDGGSDDDYDGDEGDDDEGGKEEQESSESRALEQQFMLKGIRAAQMLDLVGSSAPESESESRAALARLELEIDKTLLQLLAIECREGEERGMRALEVVGLMRDRSGRMAEAACRIAERYGRSVLGGKIRELGERLVAAAAASDDGGMDDDF